MLEERTEASGAFPLEERTEDLDLEETMAASAISEEQLEGLVEVMGHAVATICSNLGNSATMAICVMATVATANAESKAEYGHAAAMVR